MGSTGDTCTLNPLTTEADFNQQISTLPSPALAVIYFHAPWAEPCKQMSTILSTLASTYKNTSPPTVSFLSIDAEELSEVSEQYDVTQVPFIVLQKGGKVVDTISGSDASRVRTAVEKHAGPSDGNPGKMGLPPQQSVNKPVNTTAVNGGTKDVETNGTSAGNPATASQHTNGDKAGEEEELQGRLAELVKAAPVMLFMKGTPSAPQCGFSRQTVGLLREKGIRYGFFNILADDDVRQGLKTFSDWPTFPQVYAGGELLGGLDIVSAKPLRALRPMY